MSWLDRFRNWVWRVEERSNELEYSALDEVHKAEDKIDETTHGRFYDAVEGVEERSEDVLHDLHLDTDPGAPNGNDENEAV